MNTEHDLIVGTFIERASKAQNLNELGAVFFGALKDMGFTEWGYQALSRDGETPVVLSTFPREWVDYYLENNLCAVDPLVTKVPQTFTPFQWSELLKTDPLTSQQQAYWAEADDYGLSDGIGIPIHSPNGQLSIVTLVSRGMKVNQLSKVFNNYRNHVHILSLVYNTYASAMLATQNLPEASSVQLTNREQQCLQWAAKGKTSWEISEILHISEHTAIFHIENAKKKFGVFSRQEAITKGLLCGLIKL